MNLTYDDGSHLYKLDGLTIPSVTQIIKEAGLSEFNNVPDHVLEHSRIIGKHVHLATELYDKKDLDMDSLDPYYKKYLDSWIDFCNDYKFVPTEIELQLFHKVLRYAGTIDRVGLIGKTLAIVDIKTGAKVKSTKIQTAGYQLLYNYDKTTVKAKKRFAVYLKATGYQVEEHTSNNDVNVFLAALTITNYKRS